MAVRIPDSDPAVDRFALGDPVCDRRHGHLRIVGRDPDVDVDAPSGVRDPDVRFPQFEIEGPGREPRSASLLAPVDDLEPEVSVQRFRVGERFDLEDDPDAEALYADLGF